MHISKELFVTMITATTILSSFQLSAMEKYPEDGKIKTAVKSRYGQKSDYLKLDVGDRSIKFPDVYSPAEIDRDFVVSCQYQDLDRVKRILNMPRTDMTALHRAIMSANVYTAKRIIEGAKKVSLCHNIFSVERTDKCCNHKSVLQFAQDQYQSAVDNDDKEKANNISEIIDFLRSEQTNQIFACQLRDACKNENIDAVKKILEGTSWLTHELILFTDSSMSQDALKHAIESGNLEIVKLLIAHLEKMDDFYTTLIYGQGKLIIQFAKIALSLALKGNNTTKAKGLGDIIDFLEGIHLNIGMSSLVKI